MNSQQTQVPQQFRQYMPLVNADVAYAYAQTPDKLAFVADLTGASVDSSLTEWLEFQIEGLAVALGYMD